MVMSFGVACHTLRWLCCAAMLLGGTFGRSVVAAWSEASCNDPRCFESAVVELDDASFDEYVKKHDHVLVMFCNKWSRHCKSIQPSFVKLAGSLQKRGLLTRLASIDVSTQSALIERFAVTRYPGFRYFKHVQDGVVVVDYSGAATEDALLQWLAEHEKPELDWKELLDNPVVQLTSNNFTRYLEENTRVLVKFYAPWCKHCATLAPEYEAAARQLRRESRTTKLAKVDATEEIKLAKRYSIHSYPVLKYFAHGTENAELEARDKHAIAKWLRYREVGGVEKIESAQLQSWLVDKELAVVLFSTIVAKRHRILELVASDFLGEEEYHFTHVKAAKRESEGKRESLESGTLMLHRKGFREPDAEVVEFKGVWSRENLRDWIRKMSYPCLGDYDHKPQRYMPHQGSAPFLSAAMIISVSVRFDALKQSMESFLLKRTHAWKLKNLHVAWADIHNASNDGELLRKTDGSPQITLLEAHAMKPVPRRFVLRGNSSLANETEVMDFVDRYFSGSLKPAFKSQPLIVRASRDSSITTLVGDSFEEIVFAETHDVFVKFHAPWCGQCQKLAPTWTEFARTVHHAGFDNLGVLIAEMDSTQNECVEEVPGYPHLVLYPAVKGGEKMKMREKIVFKGNWNVATFRDFLENNARNLEQGTTPTCK